MKIEYNKCEMCCNGVLDLSDLEHCFELLIAVISQ